MRIALQSLHTTLSHHLDQWRTRYQQALQRHPRRTAIFTFILMGMAAGVWAIFYLFLLVYLGVFGPLPTYEALRQLRQEEASIVFSADQQRLGLLYRTNRILAEAEEIPPFLHQALIATEDARFFEHSGIDLIALARVLIKSLLLFDQRAGGGSTLTQQLAKNLYPRRDYSLLSLPVNKVREMIIAHRLEHLYDKETLLLMYLNTVPFGHNAWGIKMAAWRYFGKSPHELLPEEMAILIGILKGTSYYDPIAHPERARTRRNVVLHRMYTMQLIDSSQYDSLSRLPLQLNIHEATADQKAPYLLALLQRQLPLLLEEVPWYNNRPWNIYTDGLRIYTTIDARLQLLAEQSLQQVMPNLERAFARDWGRRAAIPTDLLWQVARKSSRYQSWLRQGYIPTQADSLMAHWQTPMTLFDWQAPHYLKRDTCSPLDSIAHYLQLIHAGLLAVAPNTGAIKVWVGGIDWRFFQYDQVRAFRQTGSLFKPIVFAAALEAGWKPCDYLPVQEAGWAQADGTFWKPRNAHQEDAGVRSLTSALARSTNTIAARLLYEVGLDRVRALAKRAGLSQPIPQVPSIALGTATASLEEMVAFYAAICHEGLLPPLWYIQRIETRQGDTLWVHPPPDPDHWPRIMSDSAAYALRRMLQAVIDDTAGTAHSLRTHYGLPGPLLGKTGTTQRQADSWFIAASPRLVVGARTGHEYPRVHWRSMRGQAALTALPLVGTFLRKAYRQRSTRHYFNGLFPLLYFGPEFNTNCPPWLPDSSWIQWVHHPAVPPNLLYFTLERYKRWQRDSLTAQLPFHLPWHWQKARPTPHPPRHMRKNNKKRWWHRIF